jgi:hypothetical protein
MKTGRHLPNELKFSIELLSRSGLKPVAIKRILDRAGAQVSLRYVYKLVSTLK